MGQLLGVQPTTLTVLVVLYDVDREVLVVVSQYTRNLAPLFSPISSSSQDGSTSETLLMNKKHNVIRISFSS